MLRAVPNIRGSGQLREPRQVPSYPYGSRSREDQDRMKKIAFIVALLAACVTVGRAQESRQDISLSGFGLIEPFVSSSTNVEVNSTPAYGALLSYRFMLTPTVAMEANYGISYQNKIGLFIQPEHYNVPVRTQELSGALVKSFVYKNWNPFVEGGPAALIFLPIVNSGLTYVGASQQTRISGLGGAGFAYEISPSFDIRAEYRGFITKVPSFGIPSGDTKRWYWISEPTVGVAYHF
jgi:outer membrane immunogenic protein